MTTNGRDDQACRPVLLVEDDDEVRFALRDVLECEGYAVTEAANGHEALKCLARIGPCLILLDLMMPVMDGFEFLTALRRQGAPVAATPVVIVSAWRNQAAMMVGVQGVVDKPVDLNRLLGYLREFCGLSSS